MKFGFGHVPAEDFRRHVRLVKLAEDLGYEYAWIPDQTFHRDPVALLAVMALATSRIRLGLGVVNPFTRHPALVAREAATIDEISHGRFALGIGAGNRRELLAPLGLDTGHAASRCREMAEMVRALLTRAPTEYHGRHFQASRVELEFKGRPDLEIYIAGRGPKVLEAAGAVADGAIVGGLCNPRGLSYALDRVRVGAAASGRDPASLEIVSWVTCHLTDDRKAGIHLLQPVVAHIINGAPMVVLEAAGLPFDLMRRIKEVMATGGPVEAGRLVTEDCVDALTIVGDPGHCAERIRSLGSAGVTQVSLLMPPGEAADYEARLLGFARTVFPLLDRPERGTC